MATSGGPGGGKSLLAQLQKDELFAKFVDPKLDTTSFVSSVIKSGQVSTIREKLVSGVSTLQDELRNEVITKHDELLHQVASLQNLDSSLSLVNTGAHNLQASVARLRAEITEPFERMKQQTVQLERVLAATQLLRRVHRFLQLISSLRTHLYGSVPDLAKAAQAVYELECELKERDLSGVQVVEDEAAWVAQAGAKVRSDAERILAKGLEELSQAELGSALQIFYNVRGLQERVGGVVARITDQLAHAVHSALDPQSLAEDARGAGQTPTGPGQRAQSQPARGGAWRAALWARLESMLEFAQTCCMQVWQLQKVLAKKRDPVTRACFLEELVGPGERTIAQTFWSSMTDIFRDEFEGACKSSQMLQDALVAEYPKLLRTFNDALTRLFTQIRSMQGTAVTTEEEQAFLEGALSALETAFLTASFQRLSQRVQAVFATRSGAAFTQPRAELDALVKAVQEEVASVAGHAALCGNVAKNAGRALRLFAATAEQMILTGSEATVLGKGTTPAQATNAALCNSAMHLLAGIEGVLASLPEGAAAALRQASTKVSDVADAAMAPVFSAAAKKLENTLLAMHKEDWLAGPGAAENEAGRASGGPECSRYMRVVVRQITNLRENAMALYTASPMFAGHARRLAARVMLFFVRHLALVRPLNDDGKLRMAADLAQMEAALQPLCQPLQKLGQPYRALRAFKSLVFMETAALAAGPEKDQLPPSAVLHHLFSRAPDELQLPHARLGMTEAGYSDWMDAHGEAEAWAQCQASLEAYTRRVTARGDTQFAPVYPVILSLGPALLEAWQAANPPAPGAGAAAKAAGP
eukprot:tig00021108_g18333.t1